MDRHPTSPLRARVLGTLITVACLHCTSAWANEKGGQGRIVQLAINAQGSEEYASFHGSVTVRRDGGKSDEYRWGGTLCPSSVLTTAEVAILSGAFHQRHRTQIRPRFKPGEVSGIRCLVGFDLVGK